VNVWLNLVYDTIRITPDFDVAGLTLEDRMRFNVQTLGTIAMATSPLMLLEFLLIATGHLPGGEFGAADAIIGLVYLCGFLAALVGLRKLRITGNRIWAGILFYCQVGLLFLAALQQALELLHTNTSSHLFALADAAWPLSHILMCGTGVAVLIARRWRGYRASLPFLCGLAVPALIATQALAGKETGRLAFAALATTGFGLLGYALRSGSASPNGGDLPYASCAQSTSLS
jgi:hypothetical protein